MRKQQKVAGLDPDFLVPAGQAREARSFGQQMKEDHVIVSGNLGAAEWSPYCVASTTAR